MGVELQIIYKDDWLVAINKPNGMLVHRTTLAAHEDGPFALQEIRNLIGKHVYPVHRLDRPTSGVLLFALQSSEAADVQRQFDEKLVEKTYWAICRGFCPLTGIINAPLQHEETGVLQEAETHFKRLATIELPITNAQFATTRFSLVEVKPKTGRMHQIRKHFAKIRHYLIGDTKHGNLQLNRAFQAYTDCSGLLLHAKTLSLRHPSINEIININAPLSPTFEKIISIPNWKFD